MLNQTTSMSIGRITNQVSFNAPSTGILQRSHPKSNFMRFHKKSSLAEWIFSDYPRLTKYKDYKLDEDVFPIGKIIVLQILVFGNDEFLIEYVYEKDTINEKENEKI